MSSINFAYKKALRTGACSMNQMVDFLKNTLIYWDDISEDEQNEILENAVSVKYKAGESVHSAMDDCVGMLLVKSGQMRTYILSDRGKEFTLFRLEPGGICVLSASCLLKSIKFDVFIDAEEDCELVLINAMTLSRLHAKNPVIENFALKIIADKFSAVVKTMEKMLFISFDRRLAQFLIWESEKRNSTHIPLTHEQIARYISSAREVVSRTLKKFEKCGAVKLHRGGVEITDISKLKEISNHENDD